MAYIMSQGLHQYSKVTNKRALCQRMENRACKPRIKSLLTLMIACLTPKCRWPLGLYC